MIRASILFLALATLTATGCKKKEGGGASEAPKPTKLDTLGLQLDVPGPVELGKAIAAEGYMLTGSGIGALQVETEDQAKSLDEAKSDADMYSPKKLKTETLADGWAMTFENKGGMGTNYWVEVHRTIDGKSFKCSTTGHDPGQAAAVLAACKSLRK